MSNIYLRLPSSRCQFFRNRDANPQKALAPHEPLEFSRYMPEYRVLLCSLTNASAITQHVNDQCFSQQQWHNMLRGCSPLGGKVLFQRNKDEYLTFPEVQTLLGKRDYEKSDAVDYLCIKLPYEVDVVDTRRPVTPTWNLDSHGVRSLITLLNDDFKRDVIEWVLSTFDYCTSGGRIVLRAQTAMLERWLMRYGIEPNQYEKDNIRRVVDRWLKTESINFSSYSCIDMRYIDSKEKILDIAGIEIL